MTNENVAPSTTNEQAVPSQDLPAPGQSAILNELKQDPAIQYMGPPAEVEISVGDVKQLFNAGLNLHSEETFGQVTGVPLQDIGNKSGSRMSVDEVQAPVESEEGGDKSIGASDFVGSSLISEDFKLTTYESKDQKMLNCLLEQDDDDLERSKAVFSRFNSEQVENPNPLMAMGGSERVMAQPMAMT